MGSTSQEISKVTQHLTGVGNWYQDTEQTSTSNSQFNQYHHMIEPQDTSPPREATSSDIINVVTKADVKQQQQQQHHHQYQQHQPSHRASIKSLMVYSSGDSGYHANTLPILTPPTNTATTSARLTPASQAASYSGSSAYLAGSQTLAREQFDSISASIPHPDACYRHQSCIREHRKQYDHHQSHSVQHQNTTASDSLVQIRRKCYVNRSLESPSLYDSGEGTATTATTTITGSLSAATNANRYAIQYHGEENPLLTSMHHHHHQRHHRQQQHHYQGSSPEHQRPQHQPQQFHTRSGYLFNQNPAISGSLPNYAETRALLGSHVIDSGSLDYSVEEPLSLPVVGSVPTASVLTANQTLGPTALASGSLASSASHIGNQQRISGSSLFTVPGDLSGSSYTHHSMAPNPDEYQHHQHRHRSMSNQSSYNQSSSYSQQSHSYSQSHHQQANQARHQSAPLRHQLSVTSGTTTGEPIASSSIASGSTSHGYGITSSTGSGLNVDHLVHHGRPSTSLSRHSALPALLDPPSSQRGTLDRQRVRPVFQKSSSTPSSRPQHQGAVHQSTDFEYNVRHMQPDPLYHRQMSMSSTPIASVQPSQHQETYRLSTGSVMQSDERRGSFMEIGSLHHRRHHLTPVEAKHSERSVASEHQLPHLMDQLSLMYQHQQQRRVLPPIPRHYQQSPSELHHHDPFISGSTTHRYRGAGEVMDEDEIDDTQIEEIEFSQLDGSGRQHQHQHRVPVSAARVINDSRHGRRRRSSLELERQQQLQFGNLTQLDYEPEVLPQPLGMPTAYHHLPIHGPAHDQTALRRSIDFELLDGGNRIPQWSLRHPQQPPRINVSPEYLTGRSMAHDYLGQSNHPYGHMTHHGDQQHFQQTQIQPYQTAHSTYQTPADRMKYQNFDSRWNAFGSRSMAMGSDSELNTRGLSSSHKLYYVHVPPTGRRSRHHHHHHHTHRQPQHPPQQQPQMTMMQQRVMRHPADGVSTTQLDIERHQSQSEAIHQTPRSSRMDSTLESHPLVPQVGIRTSKEVTFDGRTSAPIYGRQNRRKESLEPNYLRTNSEEYGEHQAGQHYQRHPYQPNLGQRGLNGELLRSEDAGFMSDEQEIVSSVVSHESPERPNFPQTHLSQVDLHKRRLKSMPLTAGEFNLDGKSAEHTQYQEDQLQPPTTSSRSTIRQSRPTAQRQQEMASGDASVQSSQANKDSHKRSTPKTIAMQQKQHSGGSFLEAVSISDNEGGVSLVSEKEATNSGSLAAPTSSSRSAEKRARVRDQQSSNERSVGDGVGSNQSLKSQSGGASGSGLTKKSNSTTQLSLSGKFYKILS